MNKAERQATGYQDIIVLQSGPSPSLMVLQDLCKQHQATMCALNGCSWHFKSFSYLKSFEVTLEDSDQERQRSEREADELRKQLAETSADTRHCFGTETAGQA